MPVQALLWQKLAFSSTFSYFNYLSSILLFRRHCDIAIFNPSSRFVKDHVLFMPIHLTGVLCPFAQVLFALSFLVHLVLTGVLACTSCPLKPFSCVFQPTGFLWCSLFLFSNGGFQLCSSSLYSFFQICSTFSRFFGFTHWSKKQLSFTSSLSLPFSLRCHSRSRDKILS